MTYVKIMWFIYYGDQATKAAIDNRRKARANSQIHVPAECKLVFAVRVRGIIGVSPKVKKILQLSFRYLRQHKRHSFAILCNQKIPN